MSGCGAGASGLCLLAAARGGLAAGLGAPGRYGSTAVLGGAGDGAGAGTTFAVCGARSLRGRAVPAAETEPSCSRACCSYTTPETATALPTAAMPTHLVKPSAPPHLAAVAPALAVAEA